MIVVEGRKLGEPYEAMCPRTYEIKEHRSYIKTTITVAESYEHAKQKLEKDYGGEWHIFDKNHERVL